MLSPTLKVPHHRFWRSTVSQEPKEPVLTSPLINFVVKDVNMNGVCNVNKKIPGKYENLASGGARKLNDKQIAECSPFFHFASTQFCGLLRKKMLTLFCSLVHL